MNWFEVAGAIKQTKKLRWKKKIQNDCTYGNNNEKKLSTRAVVNVIYTQNIEWIFNIHFLMNMKRWNRKKKQTERKHRSLSLPDWIPFFAPFSLERKPTELCVSYLTIAGASNFFPSTRQMNRETMDIFSTFFWKATNTFFINSGHCCHFLLHCHC